MLPAGARFEPVNGNRCSIEQGSTFCQSSDRVAWQVCLRSCVPYFSTLERRKNLDEKRIYSKFKASEALKYYTVGRIIIILSCSGLFSTKNFRPFFPPINMESSGCFHMQFASYKCFNRQFHCIFYDRYWAHPLQSEPYTHTYYSFSHAWGVHYAGFIGQSGQSRSKSRQQQTKNRSMLPISARTSTLMLSNPIFHFQTVVEVKKCKTMPKRSDPAWSGAITVSRTRHTRIQKQANDSSQRYVYTLTPTASMPRFDYPRNVT